MTQLLDTDVKNVAMAICRESLIQSGVHADDIVNEYVTAFHSRYYPHAVAALTALGHKYKPYALPPQCTVDTETVLAEEAPA